MKSRFVVVDHLRGWAALAVCWFHMTHGGGLLAESWSGEVGQWGWLGVDVFFVISGFVIPLSLDASGYRLADYGRFILKRIIRLEPPYLLSLLVVLGLGVISPMMPGFRGDPFHFDLGNTLGHLAYINAFLGWPWLNPVYWSLAIEFQYYVSVGLLFPILASHRPGIFALTMTGLLLLSTLFPSSAFVLSFIPLFALGMVAFRWRVIPAFRWWDFLPAAIAFLLIFTIRGWPVATCAAVSFLAVAFIPNGKTKLPSPLGLISYSLFLIHVPIGGRIVNFSSRYVTGPWGQLGACLLGLIVSCLAAVAFYFLIEKRARIWSSRIRLKPKSVLAESAA